MFLLHFFLLYFLVLYIRPADENQNSGKYNPNLEGIEAKFQRDLLRGFGRRGIFMLKIAFKFKIISILALHLHSQEGTTRCPSFVSRLP